MPEVTDYERREVINWPSWSVWRSCTRDPELRNALGWKNLSYDVRVEGLHETSFQELREIAVNNGRVYNPFDDLTPEDIINA